MGSLLGYEVFSGLCPHCIDFLTGGHLLFDLLEPSLSTCSYGMPHSLWLRVELSGWPGQPLYSVSATGLKGDPFFSAKQETAMYLRHISWRRTDRSSAQLLPPALLLTLLFSPTPWRTGRQALCRSRCPARVRSEDKPTLTDILPQPRLLTEGKVKVFSPAQVG